MSVQNDSPASYYKIIGGVRYDRALLEAAAAFAKTGAQVSLREIEQLYKMASDGRSITETERKTLIFIAKTYKFSEKARAWIDEQLGTAEPAEVEKIVERVLRTRYGLKNIGVEIGADDVRQYEDTSTRTFESALGGAVEALIRRGFNQLSFEVVVAKRDLTVNGHPNPESVLLSHLDKGTLFLVPMDETRRGQLPYDLPEILDFDNFWIFGFQSEEFTPLVFYAFVLRNQNDQHSKGQFSRKFDLETIIKAAVRQYGFYNRMKWQIDPEELRRQLPIVPGQNFGNALFAAVNSGIYNRESSFSFGDAVAMEVWPDPEVELREQIRAYANAGTLHLVPLDYRAQTEAGTAAFPVPEQFSFWLDGEWIFGLEMPGKTDFKVILSAPRDGNDGDTAWSDTFTDDSMPVEALLRKIVDREFGLQGLQYTLPSDRFESQRLQYGPDWYRLPALFRLVLNTLLHDYLSPASAFNLIAKRHKDEVNPANHDDPKEYRASVRHYIKKYLTADATLELMPPGPDENVAPEGETLEQNWLFRAVLPDLADHYLWIIVPRWPEEGQVPYMYMA